MEITYAGRVKRMISRDKKAALEMTTMMVVKLVIAALCIIALIYLAASMYGLLRTKTAVEQAKSTLDEINLMIKNLAVGKTDNYLIVAPAKNYFVFYLTGITKNSSKQCVGANCMCICNDKSTDSCDKSGVCRTVGEGGISVSPSSINEAWTAIDPIPLTLTITNVNGKVFSFAFKPTIKK